MPSVRNQRPKNNHNKMITGIGTPNSQSKIPRPIIASLNSDDSRTRGGWRSSDAGYVKRSRAQDL
jgi:hypothetical protein